MLWVIMWFVNMLVVVKLEKLCLLAGYGIMLMIGAEYCGASMRRCRCRRFC